MHSNALKDPVFQALWVMGDRETNGAVRNLCAGCHTPIGTVGEEVTLNAEKGVFTAGTVTYKPWAISHFSYVRTIPPKGSDVSDYAFLVPPGLRKGELVIDAVLRYRSLSQELADTLLGEGAIEVAVVDMTAARSVLELSGK